MPLTGDLLRWSVAEFAPPFHTIMIARRNEMCKQTTALRDKIMTDFVGLRGRGGGFMRKL